MPPGGGGPPDPNCAPAPGGGGFICGFWNCPGGGGIIPGRGAPGGGGMPPGGGGKLICGFWDLNVRPSSGCTSLYHKLRVCVVDCRAVAELEAARVFLR